MQIAVHLPRQGFIGKQAQAGAVSTPMPHLYVLCGGTRDTSVGSSSSALLGMSGDVYM